MAYQSIVQQNLELTRELERQANQEAEDHGTKDKPKKMGWVVLFIALTLTFVQLGIEWLTLGMIGWILAAPISFILWLMLRSYTKQLEHAKWILNGSLISVSLPFIGLLPIDILAILYVFVKSRKALVEYLARINEKKQETPEALPEAA